jgi:hypothetical protein
LHSKTPPFFCRKTPQFLDIKVRGSEDRKKRKEGIEKEGQRGKGKGKGKGLGFPVTHHHLDLMLVVVISFIVDEAQIG